MLSEFRTVLKRLGSKTEYFLSYSRRSQNTGYASNSDTNVRLPVGSEK